MAEYINKAELKQAVRDEWQDFKTRVEVNYIVNCMPTIDIVTCKDCKYRGEGYIHSTKWLPCMAVKTNNDWFCADGERFGDNNE